ERLVRSRVHFDLTRRYSDASFTRSINELSTADALEQYGEVLLKIQTHHVDAPNWDELVRRGVTSLHAAFSEPEFLQRNLPGVPQEKVAAFCTLLPQLTSSRALRTRQDVQQLAADVAYRAAQDLGLAEPAVILEFTCGAMG